MATKADGEKRVVAVVGAGLVGSLEACLLAQRGLEVHVYEYRDDIRKMEYVPGRSINLAMSVRGLSALKEVGLDEHVKTEYGIPMYARMIHNRDGSTYPIPYGKEDQCIYSVGRRYINEILLDKGNTYDNIVYHFNHKLVKADLEKPELVFENMAPAPGEESRVVVRPQLVVGCDGAYSAVRKEMMKRPRFNYSQEYIPHAYMELCLPAADASSRAPSGGKANNYRGYQMPPNYLHIWPRGQFMMIGLPNQDRSFTITLFMPTEKFAALSDPAALLAFFEENFRDAIPLIGVQRLVADYFANKALPLVSVKCYPYHVGATSVIMGDAAHAMVPFYGQGMNCGMEDCLVLNSMLEQHGGQLGPALEEYSRHRNPDAEAMCDLAMYNYVEMRDLVNKKSFLIRKKLDTLLNYLLPRWWVPLYTSVTFSRMRYHRCIANRAWQDRVLSLLSGLGAAGLAGAAGLYLLAARASGSAGMGQLAAAATALVSGVQQHIKAIIKL